LDQIAHLELDGLLRRELEKRGEAQIDRQPLGSQGQAENADGPALRSKQSGIRARAGLGQGRIFLRENDGSGPLLQLWRVPAVVLCRLLQLVALRAITWFPNSRPRAA
jgi:hypothetical protein